MRARTFESSFSLFLERCCTDSRGLPRPFSLASLRPSVLARWSCGCVYTTVPVVREFFRSLANLLKCYGAAFGKRRIFSSWLPPPPTRIIWVFALCALSWFVRVFVVRLLVSYLDFAERTGILFIA